MIDIIIKRDGRKVPFDPQKITDAIMKAFQASNSAKDHPHGGTADPSGAR